MAADISRDGHGQDVGWLLCHELYRSYVSPKTIDPRDGKLEAILMAPVVAFTEQSKLETLLILC